MPRKSVVPEDIRREVAELCEKGELTNDSAVEWLNQRGFDVSRGAVQRARTTYRPAIRTERRIAAVKRPSLEELPEVAAKVLMRLEDTIATFHEFGSDLKKQLLPFEEGIRDPQLKYEQNLLRAEIRKNFEAEVKAIGEMGRFMAERRTIIQSIRVGELGNTEDRYTNGYAAGMADAKALFLRICKDCKGLMGPARIIEATFAAIPVKEEDTSTPPKDGTPSTQSEQKTPPKPTEPDSTPSQG
jgi:hypothetical protein